MIRCATLALTLCGTATIALAQNGTRTPRTSEATGTATTSATATSRFRRNRAPLISGAAATSVAAGSLYSFAPVASDPEGNALTFTIRNRPAWATFSSVTGRLLGTPQVANAGTYSDIVISVSDGRRATSLAPFSIVVTAPAGNSAPVISGVPPASVQAGNAYAFIPTAADANGDPLTFTIANRPAWATFNTGVCDHGNRGGQCRPDHQRHTVGGGCSWQPVRICAYSERRQRRSTHL
jgi:hypothetical protein